MVEKLQFQHKIDLGAELLNFHLQTIGLDVYVCRLPRTLGDQLVHHGGRSQLVRSSCGTKPWRQSELFQTDHKGDKLRLLHLRPEAEISVRVRDLSLEIWLKRSQDVRSS
jgi:hypothetical protein